MCTKDQAFEILKKAYYRSAALFGDIKDAYLYGSYARGDCHSESDIDILLSVPLSAERIAQRRMDMAKITSELSLEYDVTVSVAVKPAEQFERYKTLLPYYKNVISEGIRYAG